MAICIKSGEKIFFICPFFLLTMVGYYDKICSTLPIYFVMGKFLKKEGIVIKTEKEDQRQTDSDLAQRKPPCGARFSMLSRAFKRRIDERVGQMGLTAVQCDVLGNLHRLCFTRQEVLQKDLEKMSRVTHPTMTDIIARLEKNGFVRCEPSKTDRRAKAIYPTAKCEEVHAAIQAAEAEVFTAISRGLTKRQIEEFFRITDIMLENSRQMHCCAYAGEGKTQRKEQDL